MRKPFLVTAILIIIAVVECAAQDSVKSDLNSVELSFRHEHYPQGVERSFLHLQYGRKIGRADVFAKVLRYSLNETVSYLYESEAYLKFKRKGYAYFDAAYSASEVLPNYRLRAEIFQNWKQFEYSLGLGLVIPHTFEGIPFITGTIGYYFSDYFVYARPTFSRIDDGFSKSLFIQGRRYFHKTGFLAISVLRGADTGTNRNINAIVNTFGLDTYLVRVNGQAQRGKYKVGIGFDHGGYFITAREEYMRFAGFDVFVNRSF